MNSSVSTMTARIPNTFGMPASGHALIGGSACAPALRGADAAARQRWVDGDITAAAKANFPGTPAWRPPSC